jgi:UV DNA damage endonuclease
MPELRLGYTNICQTLRPNHIFTGRTARIDTIKKLNHEHRERRIGGIKLLIELSNKNLDDLLTILKWNLQHDIYFYRVGSNLFPHMTNVLLMSSAGKANYRTMAYSITIFKSKLKEIGKFAKKHNMRLTFHPEIFVTLNSPNPQTIINSKRDLYYHLQMAELMGLDDNCVFILHGGGVYGDKLGAMKRWIHTFKTLPHGIQKRIVIENDEYMYSIEDVLEMGFACHIPIVFDMFHYKCYNKYHQTPEGMSEEASNNTLAMLFPLIIKSWGNRRVKMHLSEQRPGEVLGAHSDFISQIPKILKDFPKKYNRDLDIMLESKKNELTLLKLRE